MTLVPSDSSLSSHSRPNLPALVGVALLAAAAIAPTLPWLEFSSGSENLVVATALEIRREGNWSMPTLQGEPRTNKPPLAAWLAALSIDDETLGHISNPDPARREKGFRCMALRIRAAGIPMLVMWTLAVGITGTMIGGRRAGVLAAAVCVSTYGFLRFSRYATTDVQLAAWVAVANALLAAAALRARIWLGLVGGAVALAMAFLSKGPVCLVQSVVPLAAFVLWRRWAQRRYGPAGGLDEPDLPPVGSLRWRAAALAGCVLFAAIALPWFILVAARHPEVLSRWWVEVTRHGARLEQDSDWYSYISIFAMVLPWVVFFVGGLVLVVPRCVGRRGLAPPSEVPDGGRPVLALALLAVPIFIMSFFADRAERYLLPMLGPAAILAALSLDVFFRTVHERSPLHRLMLAIHWPIVIAAGIVFPLALSPLTAGWLDDELRWFTLGLAAAAAGAAALLILAGMWWQRRWPAAMVLTTAAVAFIAQAMYAHGYGTQGEGRSDMRPLAEAVWAAAPEAEAYSFTPDSRLRQDFSIYLNRTVHRVQAISAIAPSARPQVLLSAHKVSGPPLEIPADWRPLASVRKDNRIWSVHVRP